MTTPADDALPPACTCPTPWEHLVAVIEGRRLRARPAATLGPAAALYRAQCAACGAPYPGHWRLAPGQRLNL
ncbi:hypothetical protein AB0K09_28325 [Streptomyces sp. NPDC049577]|uniref:hypothetical protein n=1 Tax=Streptomyces sp. NPDC049577 TaxID=3155153 RepID=UPI00344AAE9C